MSGHKVPIIDRGQVTGYPGREFAEKNQELQGNIGTQEESQEEAPARKSQLVEIPTATARELYRINSIFPLDFFPDELVIDEIKVSVIYRHFLSHQINNILIKDITDITLNSTLFFGSLIMTGGEYEGFSSTSEDQKGPLTISKLWLQEAQIAKRIILGLTILSDQKVDTTQMTVEDILKKTTELGND